MGQAPQTFTVARTVERSDEPWGDNKDMLTTKVEFTDDPSRQWKIHHNVAWPVEIAQGVELEGWKNFQKDTFGLSNKHKGEHAKRSSTSSTAGGSRQSDGPGLSWRSAPFERGAEHPRNEARQIHTSALSAAPGYYELLRTEGVIPQAESKAAMLDTLAGITQWLESGYGPVLEAVSHPAGGGQQNGAERPQQLAQEVPADMAGLEPQAAPAGTDEFGF